MSGDRKLCARLLHPTEKNGCCGCVQASRSCKHRLCARRLYSQTVLSCNFKSKITEMISFIQENIFANVLCFFYHLTWKWSWSLDCSAPLKGFMRQNSQNTEFGCLKVCNIKDLPTWTGELQVTFINQNLTSASLWLWVVFLQRLSVFSCSNRQQSFTLSITANRQTAQTNKESDGSSTHERWRERTEEEISH